MKGLRDLLCLPEEPSIRDLTPQAQMGMALAAVGKPTYAGTVPEHVVQRRRAANRRARASRRINRRRSQ